MDIERFFYLKSGPGFLYDHQLEDLTEAEKNILRRLHDFTNEVPFFGIDTIPNILAGIAEQFHQLFSEMASSGFLYKFIHRFGKDPTTDTEAIVFLTQSEKSNPSYFLRRVSNLKLVNEEGLWVFIVYREQSQLFKNAIVLSLKDPTFSLRTTEDRVELCGNVIGKPGNGSQKLLSLEKFKVV